jgi:hypothetical protein
MAKLEFKFLANDTGLQTGIKNSKKALSGFESSTKGVSTNIAKALGGIGTALAVAGLARGLTNAAKAASEDATQQRVLATQLKTTTGASDAQIASAEDFITAMSKSAGIADDVLRPALGNAVRATGSLQEGQDLLAIGLDAAAASGKPLAAVMPAITKAADGNLKALDKLTPGFSKTGGSLDDFAASVAGAAEANKDPFAAFTISLDEAKETIGTAFLPVLEKLMDALTPLIEKVAPVLAKVIEALIPAFDKLIPVFITIIEAILPLIPVVLTLIEAFLPLIEQILPPLVDLLMNLIPVLIPIVEFLTTLLVPIIQIIVDWIKVWLDKIGELIDNFPKIAEFFQKAFEGIADFFKGIVNGMIDNFEGFVNGFVDGINTVIDGLNAVGEYGPFKFHIDKVEKMNIPRLATGGVVMPSPGGSIVNVAEAGQAEAIIPLDRLGNMGGANQYVININKAAVTGQEIVRAIMDYEKTNGRKFVM